MSMTPEEESKHILSIIANIRADVLLGKKLEIHLNDVNNTIADINEKVDNLIHNKMEVGSHIELGYELYRLRDDILEEIENKNGHPF